MSLRGKAMIGLGACAIAAATRAVVVDARDPRLWFGLAALCCLSALLVWRRRDRAGVAASAPVTAETAVHRNATVYIGSGAGRVEEDRRSTAKMGTPRTPASEPQTFGRYRLLRRIDGGGMADIYTAALHGAEGFRRLFVIKRLRPELARNRNAVEQFIDEAKLGSSLVSPEHCPGVRLRQGRRRVLHGPGVHRGARHRPLLQRHVERIGRPLDERLMLFVAHEVLDALAYAHAQRDAEGRRSGSCTGTSRPATSC